MFSKINIKSALVVSFVFFSFGVACKTTGKKSVIAADLEQKSSADTVYKSDELLLVKLSDHIYQHISFLNTNDYGRVGCNGMVVVNVKEAIIFDTPANEVSSEELIRYVLDTLNSEIRALIPTHFHADCVAGLSVFKKYNIETYASAKTVSLLQKKGDKNTSYIQPFTDSLILSVGDAKVIAKCFGEGHTKDNIVGYFPADQAMFGGCLIKESNATKGNLEDANVADWSATVSKLKAEYPAAKIIIPGHGVSGGVNLLDYTISLFE